jgi:hypothetical protein
LTPSRHVARSLVKGATTPNRNGLASLRSVVPVIVAMSFRVRGVSTSSYMNVERAPAAST